MDNLWNVNIVQVKGREIMAFLLGPCLVGIGYAQCCEDNGGLNEDRALGMHTDCSACK